MHGFEEYQQQAQLAKRALNKIGYDVKMEVTTVSSPRDPKNEFEFGIIYTVLVGPVGMLPYYNDLLKRQETRQVLAKWMAEHGVKANIISMTPERYTKVNAKEWKRWLKAESVELDEEAATFAYAVCLGDGDPLLEYEDIKEMYDQLADSFFGSNLEYGIGLIKNAFMEGN